MKLLVGISVCLLATPAFARQRPWQNLHPDLTSAEYSTLLDIAGTNRLRRGAEPVDAELQAIIDLGRRNLSWVAAINGQRPDADQLQLSTPETTVGYPVDRPSVSNPTIIKQRLATLRETMPDAMQQVLFADADLPDTPLIDDATFLANARTLDRIYQSASRWLLQEPYLDEYAQYASADVRGFYYLEREADLSAKLASFPLLDATEQSRLGGYLRGICHNAEIAADACQSELAAAVASGTVTAFYDRYVGGARTLWQSFFTVENPRPDALWLDGNQFVMPFLTPSDSQVQDWLATNIEDEWRSGDWRLRLEFVADGAHPHIEFVAGATPHVNELGGDTITMDANRPIQEYAARWTIRHEFGHVLGFPDCYIEFYDVEQAAMVQYQLDVTNLMCSRQGHLQPQHVSELRRAYPEAAGG